MDNLVTRMGKDNMAQVVEAAVRAMPEVIRDNGLTGEDGLDRLVGLMMVHLRRCCIAVETTEEWLEVLAHLTRAVALGLVAMDQHGCEWLPLPGGRKGERKR